MSTTENIYANRQDNPREMSKSVDAPRSQANHTVELLFENSELGITTVTIESDTFGGVV